LKEIRFWQQNWCLLGLLFLLYWLALLLAMFEEHRENVLQCMYRKYRG
jgi:hypothetical protein